MRVRHFAISCRDEDDVRRTEKWRKEWEMKRNLIQWKFVFKLAFCQKWKIKREFNWIWIESSRVELSRIDGLPFSILSAHLLRTEKTHSYLNINWLRVYIAFNGNDTAIEIIRTRMNHSQLKKQQTRHTWMYNVYRYYYGLWICWIVTLRFRPSSIQPRNNLHFIDVVWSVFHAGRHNQRHVS